MSSFVLPIISGLAGLFGGDSTKKTTQNGTQTQTQSGTSSQTGSSTPNLNPFQQQLAQMFTQGAMKQFTDGTNLAPYQSQQLQTIQGQGTANSKTIANAAAAHGLSYSPAGQNGQTANLVNTGNQMNTFQQGIPLLQHQLQQGNLQQLMQAFSTQPTGVTTTGTGTTSGTSTGTSQMNGTESTPGGGLSGLFSGLGAGLGAPAQGGGSNLSSILNQFGLGSPGGYVSSSGSSYGKMN
jgi:hypothetical protein